MNPLTPEQVDQMEAGEEMDRLVAQEVMGWRRDSPAPDGSCWRAPHDPYWLRRELEPFSTRLDSAWAVVSIMRMLGYRFVLGTDYPDDPVEASFFKGPNDEEYATGSTPAEAICRAALLARGVTL